MAKFAEGAAEHWKETEAAPRAASTLLERIRTTKKGGANDTDDKQKVKWASSSERTPGPEKARIATLKPFARSISDGLGRT
jgi:hypothetical protein